mmetsp:Transcript_4584/g.8495  ORF Transcript_4584/g.8495 Transcript_4584/m.8495 type:complete len:193 (+) Transcript_4584:68-646(+)
MTTRVFQTITASACEKLLSRCFSTSSGNVGASAAAVAKWPEHQLNIAHALKKSDERESFRYLSNQPVEALQGIGPKHAEELKSLNLKTVQQLADYKFFHLARAMTVLSTVEEEGGRLDNTLMNINKGLDKASEKKALKELIHQPVHILQGISPQAGETLASLGVKTVEDLANFKFCQWAESIVVAAKFEEEV